MIFRMIAFNALKAALRRDWPNVAMYRSLWQACRKPLPF
jgi:hypothetical protein